MNQMLHQILHLQLVQLRDQARNWVDGLTLAGFKPWRGICHHLELSAMGWDQLEVLLAAWPGGTGDENYPVPHPRFHPAVAFDTSPPLEMWNPKYEYARNRWALLDWLIEQTKPNEESQS